MAASPDSDLEDPARLAEMLAACDAPFLIGIRHHSPACAAAVPRLLDACSPERLFLELPSDLQPWLEWLGDPQLLAPVALAAASESGGLAFYPFADFSPELAAIRWAYQRGIPVEAFDLATNARSGKARWAEQVASPPQGEAPSLVDALCRAGEAEGTEALWDQLVEARAPGSSSEAIRRAALLFGAALRLDAARAGRLEGTDLLREAQMRSRLAKVRGTRCAAVVGSFHALALLPDPLLWSDPAGDPAAERGQRELPPAVGSLIPYAFDLLDSRSGYPAGIRDPVWQQRVFESLQVGLGTAEFVGQCAVDLCREIRAQGHAAGVPDANELLRLTLDLARLRNLPGPGRKEFLEAVQSSLSQGELMGRGRVLARALQRVLVGSRRGRLPPQAPRSGLAPHLERLLAALRLPPPNQPTTAPVELRLDPVRSDLDRRRHVALERLESCGIPYATREAIASLGNTESLSSAWTVRVSPATEALVERVAVRGVTLAQAAEGNLRAARSRLEAEEQLSAKSRLALLERAAASGLGPLTTEWLLELAGPFVREAGLAELVAAAGLLGRIVRGQLPSLPREGSAPEVEGAVAAFQPPESIGAEALIAAAVRALDGLTGSERLEDARSLTELVRWYDAASAAREAPGDGRLLEALRRLAREGSPLLQGAATAALVLLERTKSSEAGLWIGSWLDATGAEGRRTMAARLRGLLVVLGPRLEADAGLLEPLLERVEELADRDFLERAPALREGFDALSPAARHRLLDELAGRYGLDRGERRLLDQPLDLPAAMLATLAEADRRATAHLQALGLFYPTPSRAAPDAGDDALRASHPRVVQGANHSLAPLDRWRLILGRERSLLAGTLAPAARALDELYGAGRGEGSGRDLSPGGGRDQPFPSVREWSQELEALFGSRVREEVLGRAAVRGRTAAALALDPETVTPSVELLEQVLSLKGAVPEGQLGQLRRIVERIISELVRALAVRVRPALAGLTTPRPTRRRSGLLDLRRTLARNLRTARPGPDGALVLLPEQPYFRTHTRRSLDWRIVLVVDVSGSMEASVIYSALMAAILAGLPAVSVHFLAFSTEVIDLTSRVQDPLGLLLEVSVGGGTHIAQALRHARSLVTVPARTLVITVSDFEEGFSVDALVAEVRALCESGVTALGLAALDDAGKPRYDVAIAEQLVAAGMPIAALTPLELARWVAERLR